MASCRETGGRRLRGKTGPLRLRRGGFLLNDADCGSQAHAAPGPEGRGWVNALGHINTGRVLHKS
jgi:hypothetical protein